MTGIRSNVPEVNADECDAAARTSLPDALMA